MQTIVENNIDKIILDALNEDLKPRGDITTESLINPGQDSKFKLIVKEDAILAGLEVFKKTFLLLEKNITFELNFHDGDKITKSQCIAIVSGNTQSILKGERTALNFICHLSGIATLTNQLVSLVKGTGVILLDTRKNTPNLRYLEKEAVVLGGGTNNRFNLSEMILIKDNHIDLACGITNAVSKVRNSQGDKIKIEVEVRNLKELEEAIFCKVDIIMFDNWDLVDLKDVVKLVPKDILTYASGGISQENIAHYAKCGVNYISTSYMIKNSKWVDFSLKAVRS